MTTEKKEKVKKERLFRLQSAKMWHEGEKFCLIYSVGLDGEKADKKQEEYQNQEEVLNRLQAIYNDPKA